MRAILAAAGVVLLTALVVLGVRGGGDDGDPTAMDTPTGTEAPGDGSTAAGEDSGPLDPTEGTDEATPSPTDDPVTDDQTDETEDATEPGEDATAEPSDGDADDGDADPAGGQSGDDAGSGDAGSGDDGSAADDVDDMPDTGGATILPLAGLALAGLALRLDR